MHQHDHDEHHHAHTPGSNRRRLSFVLALTLVYMLAEAIGGWLSNSLALLSDAGHMFTDVAALMLALFAMWFASRPVNVRKTYGYYRLEILAALANGVALVVISLLIFYEALQRIKHPESVAGFQAMLIAIGGLGVNAVSAWLLHSASSTNLNMHGAFLHVIGDALGSIGAIVAGVLIWLLDWKIADPIISVLMCLLIIFSAWQLIKESVNILLEGTPPHIDVRSVIDTLHEVQGVTDVHDLHIWTISSGKDALSAHVCIDASAQYKATLEALQNKLHSEFGITHATLQIELPDEEAVLKLYQIASRRTQGLQP
ncbi:MAG: cation diffusion facilitator family transporter [Acidobacteriota bacterium]